ncbi:uncharacterized protein VTP21DRAFT_1667 [Calcarisporiella thermophila]|uniref:uncharacterized protein n=1 Tax=Calcarisporiella thermophila TaxID=911321 RepID=UPI00374444BC
MPPNAVGSNAACPGYKVTACNFGSFRRESSGVIRCCIAGVLIRCYENIAPEVRGASPAPFAMSQPAAGEAPGAEAGFLFLGLFGTGKILSGPKSASCSPEFCCLNWTRRGNFQSKLDEQKRQEWGFSPPQCLPIGAQMNLADRIGDLLTILERAIKLPFILVISSDEMVVLRSLVALFAVVQAVYAQGQECPFITNPVQGTVWKAGDQVLVTWKPSNDNAKIQVILDKGQPQALAQVATLADGIDEDTKAIKITVPNNLAPGTDYALQIGSAGNFCYSHFFTVVGANGVIPSNSVSGVAAPSSSMSMAMMALPSSMLNSMSTMLPLPSSSSSNTIVVSSSALASSSLPTVSASASTPVRSGASSGSTLRVSMVVGFSVVLGSILSLI